MHDQLLAMHAVEEFHRSGLEVLPKAEYDRLMELRQRHFDLQPVVNFLKALEDRQVELPYSVARLGVSAWDACVAAGLVKDGDK